MPTSRAAARCAAGRRRARWRSLAITRAARRDEPRLGAAAKDGDRLLGHDDDAERVRERAVVASTPATVGSAVEALLDARRRRARAGSCPSSGASAVADLRARAPATRRRPRSVRTANSGRLARDDVARRAASSDEPRGRARPSGRERRQVDAQRGRRHGDDGARAARTLPERAHAAHLRRRAATAPTVERRQLERAEELDLVLELDAELLARAPARLGHQRDRVGACGAAGVLDEVRVPRRDLRAADPVALAARTPRASARRVSSCSGFLKTLPNVRLFVGWAALRCACISATVALISSTGRGVEPKLDLRDDLAVRGARVAVREPELVGRQPARRPSASTTSARSSTPAKSPP